MAAARPDFVQLHSLIQCPITRSTLTLRNDARILVLPCGHVCSNCPWFDNNRCCPECRAAFAQAPSDLPKCAMVESIVVEIDKGTLVLADPAEDVVGTIVQCKRVLSDLTIADGAGLLEMVENLACEKMTVDSNVDKLTQTLAELGELLTQSRERVATLEDRCTRAHARERVTRRERDRARERLNVLGNRARDMQETIRSTMLDYCNGI